jgi:hypothetical protein
MRAMSSPPDRSRDALLPRAGARGSPAGRLACRGRGFGWSCGRPGGGWPGHVVMQLKGVAVLELVAVKTAACVELLYVFSGLGSVLVEGIGLESQLKAWEVISHLLDQL